MWEIQGVPRGALSAHTSDYAGMSNDKESENLSHRKPKVSSGRYIRGGLGGP